MFTVALIGPDGVGKTSVARRLEERLPLPLKYLYMGTNAEASNVTLPTTRWWRSRSRPQNTNGSLRAPGAPTDGARRGGVRRALRKSLGFCNRILEESYRQLVARWYSRRGFIVLFDRYFLWDYYHFDIAPQGAPPSFKRRLHGQLMRRIHRPPDLVVYLDAPGEVVFRRKGEFSPEHLEMRRAQYRDLQRVIPNFAMVDADRHLDLVVEEVGRLIEDFEHSRSHATH